MQKLDARLSTAIKYLREGRVLADVGTDHAYLPIYAVENGISSFAVASDINEGPAERARLNVSMSCLSDKIEVVCCDGLSGIEKYSPDDIAVFGMGGELIANIIENAPIFHTEGKRFILQPMSCADVLRRYLAEKGFRIIGETLSSESGKLYVTICCEWGGERKSLSHAEAILGEYNIKNSIDSPLFEELLSRAENAYEIRLKGKSSAGKDFALEEEVLASLREIRKEVDRLK